MAVPDIEICKAAAIRHGLPLQFVVKEFCVFDVLSQIASQQTGLVFKGGTALNKVYLGGVQRFSEDLDFDLQAASVSELEKFCRKLAEGIRGHETGEFRRVRSTVQFYCEYKQPLGGTDHVRIDVAAKKIVHANPLRRLQAVSSYTGQSASGFLVYSLEDLTARKLMALSERQEGKDFYDVHAALPLCGKMRLPLERMLESEGRKISAGEFIALAIKAAKAADPKKLRNLANPYIPAQARPGDWKALKEDLVVRLEGLLD